MTSRRTAALTVAGALAATGVSLTVPGVPATADDTLGYSVRHILADTLAGPHGDQPCTVTADVYTPDGASRRNRKPAILTTHGFGGDKADSNQTAVGKGFVQEGYVVLSYPASASAACKIRLDDPAWDGKAGSQMLRRARRPTRLHRRGHWRDRTDPLRRARARRRPAGRDDRRLLRRSGPVRRGDAGPAWTR